MRSLKDKTRGKQAAEPVAEGLAENKTRRGKNRLEFYIIPRYSSIATKERRQRCAARCLTLHQETPQPATSSC